MRIDLHTHSQASDGTDTPTELMMAAKIAGLDVVAITDHDTTTGWDEAATAARECDIALVRGAEISCRHEGITVHMLAYLFDPTYAPLQEIFTRSQDARDSRAKRMVERISADLALTWDDVAAQAADGATIGRPHIADALVARGHVSSRAEAFDSLLSPDSPYYVWYEVPTAMKVLAHIEAAGGVAVLAHPFAAARGGVLRESDVGFLAQNGLTGIEVDHREHTPVQRAQAAYIAQTHQLLPTGSSDYHGGGKPNRLGENLTSVSVFEQIVKAGTLPVVQL